MSPFDSTARKQAPEPASAYRMAPHNIEAEQALLGAIFGLGWTPCLGPTLAGVTAIASSTGGTAARGFLLVVVYCAGLGLPFMLIAAGAGWAVRVSGWLRRHGRAIQLVGGGLLMVVGVLLAGLSASCTPVSNEVTIHFHYSHFSPTMVSAPVGVPLKSVITVGPLMHWFGQSFQVQAM